MNELGEKVEELNKHVKFLKNANRMPAERLIEIEGMFLMCDRMIECGNYCGKEVKKYNRLKRSYEKITDPYKELNDKISACKMHIEVLNRRNRIFDITKNVREIVAISEYINHTVKSTEHSVDNIAQYMENVEEYSELANKQMEDIFRKRSVRAKTLRSISLFVLAMVAIVVLIKQLS